MDVNVSSYISGLWHGGLGVTLIVFGIIGWPATRYVLGMLLSPFTRRFPRLPIGSKFWDRFHTSYLTRYEQ